VSSLSFEKYEIVVWMFILEMEVFILSFWVFISDHGIQRLIKNRNIIENEKFEEKTVEGNYLGMEILLKMGSRKRKTVRG
jgi:hypothetical protein